MAAKLKTKSAAATVAAPQAPAVSAIEIRAAAYEALARKFGGQRDMLTGGADYAVHLDVTGIINGQAFKDECYGTLYVGKDSLSSTSHGPGAGDLLAVVLAKLNAQTREAFLRDIVQEYAAAGNKLPEVDPMIVAMADATVKAMRASETVNRRGTVKFAAKVA